MIETARQMESERFDHMVSVVEAAVHGSRYPDAQTTAVSGLVSLFASSFIYLPYTRSLRLFSLLTHAIRGHANPEVRRAVLQCFLRLRGNRHYELQMVEGRVRTSRFFLCSAGGHAFQGRPNFPMKGRPNGSTASAGTPMGNPNLGPEASMAFMMASHHPPSRGGVGAPGNHGSHANSAAHNNSHTAHSAAHTPVPVHPVHPAHGGAESPKLLPGARVGCVAPVGEVVDALTTRLETETEPVVLGLVMDCLCAYLRNRFILRDVNLAPLARKLCFLLSAADHPIDNSEFREGGGAGEGSGGGAFDAARGDHHRGGGSGAGGGHPTQSSQQSPHGHHGHSQSTGSVADHLWGSMGWGGGGSIPRHGRQHVSYGGQSAAAMGGEESHVEGQGAPGRPLSPLRGQRGAHGAGVGGGNSGGGPDAGTGAGTGAEKGTGAVDSGESLLCPSAADWESVRMFGRSLRRRSRGAITNESRGSVAGQAATAQAAARPSSARPLSPSGSTDSHLSPATSPTATSPTSEGGPRGGRGRKGGRDGGGDVDGEAGGRVAGAAGAVGEVTIAPGSTPPHSAFNLPPPPRDRDGLEAGVEGEIEGGMERGEESTGGGAWDCMTQVR